MVLVVILLLVLAVVVAVVSLVLFIVWRCLAFVFVCRQSSVIRGRWFFGVRLRCRRFFLPKPSCSQEIAELLFILLFSYWLNEAGHMYIRICIYSLWVLRFNLEEDASCWKPPLGSMFCVFCFETRMKNDMDMAWSCECMRPFSQQVVVAASQAVMVTWQTYFSSVSVKI